MKLYLVIPCYNEQEVLEETAKRTSAKLRALAEGGKIESLIVTPKDGGGFFVEVRYVVEQRMNF